MTTTTSTTQKISLAVRAPREQVWRTLTDGDVSPAYYYGFRAEFDLTPGAPYRYTAGGGDMITGQVVDVTPGERLDMTFNGHWRPDVDALPESRVTIRLDEPAMPTPGVTVVTLTHEGLPDSPAAGNLESGWVLILSGLKTLLETGEPLIANA